MRTTALLLFVGAVVALESVSALQLSRVISSLTGAKEAAVESEEKQSGPVLPLPALPVLPALPPLQKVATIFATKTLFVQVTKRVTQHPVCMTVYGVKPPCLPSHHYHHDDDHHYHHDDDHEYREDGGSWEENEGLYIQPTTAVRIHATAAPGFEHSYYEREGRSGDLEASKETPEDERKGRYLEIRTATPAASSMPIEANLEEGPGSNTEARVFENLLPKSTITQLLTKTLWVTKVEKVIDHRVTATVEVKNCVPTDSKIPFCDKEHHPNHHYHDDHHGYHHEKHNVDHHDSHHESHKPSHHDDYDHKPVHHDDYDHKPVHHDDYDHKPVHHDDYDHKPVHHDDYDHKPDHHDDHDHKPVHHDEYDHKPVHHEEYDHKPIHHDHYEHHNEHHHDGEHHYKEGEAIIHKQPTGYVTKPDYHKKPTTTTTTTTTTTSTTHKPVHNYKPVHEYAEEQQHQPEYAHKPEHGSQKPVQVHWRGSEDEE